MYTDNLFIKKQISIWLGFMFLLISFIILICAGIGVSLCLHSATCLYAGIS